ncbi:MAG: B12-binding domain-containing protein, partial [Coriobacteriales bacterium]|nr:B12-binding domain-containing protein [Coriobacteriales bacterium]
IVKRVRGAAHSYGLQDNDLLFDPLTMAAATDNDAPNVTLQCVQHLTTLGLGTVLGVSNVSHGLPDRPILNAAFAAAAVAAGLSAAIVNPNDSLMRQAVKVANAGFNHLSLDDLLPEWDLALAEALRKAARGDHARLSQTVEALHSAAGVLEPGSEPRTASQRLRHAVLRGDTDSMAELIDAVVAEGTPAGGIVDSLLSPTLQDLGDDFARGQAFLPQLMLAAAAMKAAVAHIRTLLPPALADSAAGKVLFCTVKGDVHSIGKDICVALLESQGFKLYDLGVDVAIADILETAVREDIDVICLSALMTTTLPSMQATVESIHAQLPAFREGRLKAVLVGGAVVSERWASSISAAYAPDAPSCVRFVQSICRHKSSLVE